ncbi:MAG TPA: hydroxyacylglutathione hydrolase [Sphingomonadaceae bacterium]|nr:hydroxyacylglutathione hydrolase [Sphingomonadaceae bacterium]
MVTALEVVRIPALTDNYFWLLHEAESGETVVVDPADAALALAAAEARGWRIGQVWNTHWHHDHTDGNARVKAATGATVNGPAAEAARIPTLDVMVEEGDTLRIGGLQAHVIHTPGHTAGHIVFHLAQAKAAFVGDTLFPMGCGRLFEGTPADMHASLRKLAALPDDTALYCGHEYTLSNARFATATEPGNGEIAGRRREVEARRAVGEATVPTTIGLERVTNLFLRAGSADELGILRAAKDSFPS